uniref:Uncharacterized protein n=1 Tax=Rhodnius prolixus TaxID=13249 RepID=T1I5X9_RHOPR
MYEEDVNMFFQSYGDLNIHKTLLLDQARNDAYWRAIFENKDHLKDKIVMDVGAGTGILSIFCAQAGAKKVYAVEASPKLIPILKAVVRDNGVEDIVERICLAVQPQKATIYVALCDMPQLTSQWTRVHDVNLEAATNVYRSEAGCFPHIEQLNYESLISLPKQFCTFDMYKVSLEDVHNNVMRTVFVTNKSGIVEGICIWWDVEFQNGVVLSTSPFSHNTHWKQTIILLPKPINVTTGIPIGAEIAINKANDRVYTMSLTMLDAEEEEHDIPCTCYFSKCQVANAFFVQSSVQIKEEPPSPTSE